MGPQIVEEGELCYFVGSMAARWKEFPEEKMGPIAMSDRPVLREVEKTFVMASWLSLWIVSIAYAT